jgi:hypothetical protein
VVGSLIDQSSLEFSTSYMHICSAARPRRSRSRAKSTYDG